MRKTILVLKKNHIYYSFQERFFWQANSFVLMEQLSGSILTSDKGLSHKQVNFMTEEQCDQYSCSGCLLQSTQYCIFFYSVRQILVPYCASNHSGASSYCSRRIIQKQLRCLPRNYSSSCYRHWYSTESKLQCPCVQFS